MHDVRGSPVSVQETKSASSGGSCLDSAVGRQSPAVPEGTLTVRIRIFGQKQQNSLCQRSPNDSAAAAPDATHWEPRASSLHFTGKEAKAWRSWFSPFRTGVTPGSDVGGVTEDPGAGSSRAPASIWWFSGGLSAGFSLH